ncbi:MAG: hypothetical protein Q8K00_14485 [Syntrophales bacterium]|nr:hypothetical protein [Syntrophales bacterium]
MEQDLIICHPDLAENIAFWGGTALRTIYGKKPDAKKALKDFSAF